MSVLSVLRRFLAAAVLLAGIAAPLRAEARQDDEGDLRDQQRELDEVRQQAAAKAAEIDVLQATNADIEQAITDLEENVKLQSSALTTAQQKEQGAIEAAARAQAAADAKAAELAALQADASEVALSAYIQAGSGDSFVVLSTADITDAAYRKGFLASQSRTVSDVVDELGAARQDLEAEQQRAADAEDEATSKREATEEQLAAFESAQVVQQQKATEVDAKLERALAEAAALEDTDAVLAAQIQGEQADLAAQLADLQAQADAGGPVLGPSSGARVDTPDGDIQVVTVGGITVNADIGGEVQSLLEAAAADGIILGGGGYRSSQRQIELRIQNCGGNSHYAIYEKPSSQCRPPTARPGQSMHERGLAIDFTCNGGGSISSRSNPCYRWLAANADRFGLYNLPSEPWHWSTTGQ
jgi:LAS superfamily LD-carboxypeptidase LdcB